MRDLSLHLLDIIQNSITADAHKITVIISADSQKGVLTLKISDNGRGMDAELLKQVSDPFMTTRTTRKVGLGISLFKLSTERADGMFSIASERNKGTDIKAALKISHIDRLPLGDISETITGVIVSKPEITLELILESHKKIFRFCTAEVKEKLGDVSITEFEVITWIREYIDEGVKITFGGILDEIHS